MKRQLIAASIAGLMALAPLTDGHAQPRAQRLRFAPGADTITRQGVLRFGGVDRYVIRLGANDDFSVSVDSGTNNNVILIIWGADGTVLLSDHSDSNTWTGVTPSTQDYFIDARAIDGTSANYTLSVYARPIGPNPPPNPPSPRVKRIIFPPGSVSATVTGQVTPGNINEYVIRANAGQRMLVNVEAEEQRVAISVVGADGTVLLSSMPGASSFSGNLPSTQDYYIKVIIQGSGFANYRMTVTVEALVY
jgi:hypothetical protein